MVQKTDLRDRDPKVWQDKSSHLPFACSVRELHTGPLPWESSKDAVGFIRLVLPSLWAECGRLVLIMSTCSLWLDAFLPLACKPVLGRRAWTQMWALVTSGMLEVPMHTSAFQGTQESLNRQLPTAVPQTTCCELIPQHLLATSSGTISSYKDDAKRATRCNRCLQGQGNCMELSRDSTETGYFMALASRLVSPSLVVLLCHHSGRQGRCLDFTLSCFRCCSKFLLRRAE